MITDELRKWKGHIQARLAPEAVLTLRAELNAIADRIDAEHERVTMNVMNDALYQANEDDMAELGWIRLPKDANDEYVHVGDVMDSKVDYLFDGKPFMVRAMVLCEDGWEAADSRFGNRYKPDSLHHHKPTVEDVLTDFARLYDDIGGRENDDELWETLLTEYSAKLQLKESE